MTRPLSSFAAIAALLSMLHRGTECISCDGKGQVMFLVDGSSGVISDDNFANMKAAVMAVTSEFGIEPTTGYRAGLIQYGDTTADGHWADLLCCQNKLDVLARMDRLTWQNSTESGLGKGIWKMISRFQAANRSDEDTLTGVIITPSPAENAEHAETQAMFAKEMGIHLITVGVGPNSPDDLLQAIDTPGYYMKVASFDDLNTGTWTRRILSLICEDTPDCHYKTQFQFVVDGSMSVGSHENFEYTKKAIQAVVSEFTIDDSGNHTRAGMIQYGLDTADGPWVDLLCCDTLEEYIMRILNMQWQQSGMSHLRKGLWKMYSRFDASDRGSGDMLVGIIVTAGPVANEADAIEYAHKVKTEKGVTLLTVGVGVGAPNDLLNTIASPGMHMQVASYAELNNPKVIQELVGYICNGRGAM